LTNDPTPPSNNFIGVHIRPFAIVATGSVVMPGIEIGQDALVAAGCTVTKNVDDYAVVMGNPGKTKADVRNIKSKITGEPVYPWRHHFRNYMPWAECDFLTWYSSLSIEEKKEHKIDVLNESLLEEGAQD
jgi:tetrahydrodipicolinate N-succinyltransferase